VCGCQRAELGAIFSLPGPGRRLEGGPFEVEPRNAENRPSPSGKPCAPKVGMAGPTYRQLAADGDEPGFERSASLKTAGIPRPQLGYGGLSGLAGSAEGVRAFTFFPGPRNSIPTTILSWAAIGKHYVDLGDYRGRKNPGSNGRGAWKATTTIARVLSGNNPAAVDGRGDQRPPAAGWRPPAAKPEN